MIAPLPIIPSPGCRPVLPVQETPCDHHTDGAQVCLGLMSGFGVRGFQRHLPAGSKEWTGGLGGIRARFARTSYRRESVIKMCIYFSLDSYWRPPYVLTLLYCRWWLSIMRLESSSPLERLVTMASPTCFLLTPIRRNHISEKFLFRLSDLKTWPFFHRSDLPL